MTTSIAMVLLILGCALVTWIPRILPFVLVKNMKLPKIVLRWLAYIPVCILSALVIEGFFDKCVCFYPDITCRITYEKFI